MLENLVHQAGDFKRWESDFILTKAWTISLNSGSFYPPYFSTSLLKDTLKQKLFKKKCEDFDSYLIQVLGSPALQPGFGTSGEELGESTPEPRKEISETVSNCLA